MLSAITRIMSSDSPISFKQPQQIGARSTGTFLQTTVEGHTVRGFMIEASFADKIHIQTGDHGYSSFRNKIHFQISTSKVTPVVPTIKEYEFFTKCEPQGREFKAYDIGGERRLHYEDARNNFEELYKTEYKILKLRKWYNQKKPSTENGDFVRTQEGEYGFIIERIMKQNGEIVFFVQTESTTVFTKNVYVSTKDLGKCFEMNRILKNKCFGDTSELYQRIRKIRHEDDDVTNRFYTSQRKFMDKFSMFGSMKTLARILGCSQKRTSARRIFMSERRNE